MAGTFLSLGRGKFRCSIALVATMEDVSGTLDVYSEVQAQNRYQLANTLRIKVDA